MNSGIQSLSENLWRKSSLVSDLSVSPRRFHTISEVQPESISEERFLASPTPRYPFPMPPSPVAGVNPDTLPPAASPIAAALAQSLQRSADSLHTDFQRRKSNQQFATLTDSSIQELKLDNPVAYDRVQALAPEQRRQSALAGKSDDVMLLIPKAPQSGLGTPASTNSGPWEEVFAARRSLAGPTTVSGLRLQDNEWYHFTSQIATPPKSWSHLPAGKSAPAANSAFAPVRLLKSKDPASMSDLDREQVHRHVKAITEGPWRPFLQGPTLKGSDHAVQGVHSSKNGFDAFKSAYDSVYGVLKKIQDVAKGIMKAADFLGMVGELGQFGDVLKWIGALNLPKSPADLINSLILGKGILPGSAPPAPVGICNGSGEGGLVITQSGAAAEHLGKGMMLDVKILQQQGDGAPGAPAKGTDGSIGAKPGESTTKGSADQDKGKKPEDKKPEDKKPEDKKPEDEKSEDEKSEDKEAEKGNSEEKSPDEKPDDANGDADPSTAGTKKEAVLSDFKDGWHPFDESDEAERLANARGASQAGISDTSSLKDVDKVTIVAHIGVDRDNDGDRDLGTGDGNSIDAKQLAETLRKRGFNGSEVEIMACSSTAFAKELANELRGEGVTVKAYNKDVQVNIDGNVGEHPGRKGVKPDVVPPDDPVNFGTE